MRLGAISRKLAQDVSELSFSAPIAYVYNPLVYARAPHEAYLERWGEGPKQVLLLGMNPGPFGMAQTGVPFGDVAHGARVPGCHGQGRRNLTPSTPSGPCSASSARVAKSVARGCGASRETPSAAPEQFFERFFVVNYCPLVFMEELGRNRTPDKLRAARAERAVRGLRSRAAADRRGARTAVCGRCRRLFCRASSRCAGRNRRHDLDGAPPQSCEPRRQPRLGGSGRGTASRCGNRATRPVVACLASNPSGPRADKKSSAPRRT